MPYPDLLGEFRGPWKFGVLTSGLGSKELSRGADNGFRVLGWDLWLLYGP